MPRGGPDVDSVDLFFGRPEADALREDLDAAIEEYQRKHGRQGGTG
jgi:hypothetical protein